METPRLVFIDLSSACNATCVMCPTQLSPLRKKMIDPGLFARIVEQVAALPSLDLFFIGVHGEPLLDKRLPDKVKLCGESGIREKVLITTNGSLATEPRATELLEAEPGVVIFSIESLNASTFESIRKGLKHSVVVDNLKRFFEIRNRLDARTRVGVRFIESGSNQAEKEEYMAYWTPFMDIETRGDFFSLDRIHNWAYGNPDVFHGSSPCAHTGALTILSDGAVVFCCIDHDGIYQLGDANTETLLDIYHNQQARRMRELQLSGQRHTLKMCNTCDLPEQWVGKPLGLYDHFIASEWVGRPALVPA